ncbi:MAG: PQQ-binding-like beta-propeller repeat protein [Deltaproteobacteria bacterium]
MLCSLLVSRVFAEDWTEFRGPTGQGHSTARNLPAHWTTEDNVAWRHELPGKGWSSPIVLGKRLYLTAAIPTGSGEKGSQSLRTMCLDAASGEIVWDVEVFEQAGGAPMHGKNSHASPTPVTDGKRLFVHFGPHGIACLAVKDGKVLWRNEELHYAPVHGNGGSPVLVGGLVVVSCDGSDQQFVAALDQNRGTVRWRTPRSTSPAKGFSFGTPLVIEVGGKKQIVSAGSDAVMAYDPKTGREIWKVTYPGGYSVVPRPVYGDGLLYVCTGYDSPTLLAIRPEEAKGDVTEKHVAWRVKKAVPHNPSPLLVDGALYLVSDKGVATCLDARTGEERWQHRIGGDFSASPLYADGKIFLQNETGDGIVLKPGPQYEELGRNPLGEKSLASYAVGDGALFIRTERHLVRVQEK